MTDRQKRAWNRALRPDTIAFFVVIIAVAGALLITLAVVAGRSKGVRTAATKFQFSTATERSLDAALDKWMSTSGAPGAVVGIWAPGKGTWVRARGVADIKTHEPMAEGDEVRIASVTKSFVGTVVLQLADEKKLSLDDTLDKYVPSVPNGGAITIRQMLNQTSGVFDFLNDPVFQQAAAQNPLMKWKPSDLLASALDNKPAFAPGTGWGYSNSNFVLLGMIVEKVTGQTIGREITRRVITPLRLTRTSYPSGPELPGRYSNGYEPVTGGLVEASAIDPSVGGASSAMISDLEDLKTWSEALGTGALISEQAQKDRLTTVPTDRADTRYGLALMKVGDWIGHEGNAYGYSTAVFYNPLRRTSIVVIMNSETAGQPLATSAFKQFAGIVFPGSVPQ